MRRSTCGDGPTARPRASRPSAATTRLAGWRPGAGDRLRADAATLVPPECIARLSVGRGAESERGLRFVDDRARQRSPRRREETTPVSNPAWWRPPWKRACSIFRQRSITATRPERVMMSTASSEWRPSWAQNTLVPGDRDDLLGHRRQVLAAPEHVDEVRHARAGRQRATGTSAGRGSRRPSG